MSLSVVPLENRHIEDADALVAARYRALRQTVPATPPRYKDAGAFLPMLQRISSKNPGVVALDGGRLVGFLTAWQVAEWKGQRMVFGPEWGNGAAGSETQRIYEAMYTAMSAQWVADGYFNHYVSLFAHDRAGVEAWQWLNFGHYVVDAVRDLSPVAAAPVAVPGIEIRRATPADAAGALALCTGLWQHLRSAPTFLVSDPYTAEGTQEWLAHPANALWIACRGNEPVAEIGIGPASKDACTIIRDKGTASITSGYTVPALRGDGVAGAVLDRALAWARAEGYTRCSVDFEAANVLARRFWLRHFQPLCISLNRCVNPAIRDGR